MYLYCCTCDHRFTLNCLLSQMTVILSIFGREKFTASFMGNDKSPGQKDDSKMWHSGFIFIGNRLTVLVECFDAALWLVEWHITSKNMLSKSQRLDFWKLRLFDTSTSSSCSKIWILLQLFTECPDHCHFQLAGDVKKNIIVQCTWMCNKVQNNAAET